MLVAECNSIGRFIGTLVLVDELGMYVLEPAFIWILVSGSLKNYVGPIQSPKSKACR